MKKSQILGAVFAAMFCLISMPSYSIPILGDFNGDGLVDGGDVNSLTTEIVAGSNTVQFDINGDGLVNLDDLDAWFQEYVDSQGGVPDVSIARVDINFDAILNDADLIIIINNLNTVSSLFTDGDITVDGVVDERDRNLFLSVLNGTGEPPGPGPTIPEPGTIALFGLGLAGLGFARRKKA